MSDHDRLLQLEAASEALPFSEARAKYYDQSTRALTLLRDNYPETIERIDNAICHTIPPEQSRHFVSVFLRHETVAIMLDRASVGLSDSRKSIEATMHKLYCNVILDMALHLNATFLDIGTIKPSAASAKVMELADRLDGVDPQNYDIEELIPDSLACYAATLLSGDRGAYERAYTAASEAAAAFKENTPSHPDITKYIDNNPQHLPALNRKLGDRAPQEYMGYMCANLLNLVATAADPRQINPEQMAINRKAMFDYYRDIVSDPALLNLLDAVMSEAQSELSGDNELTGEVDLSSQIETLPAMQLDIEFLPPGQKPSSLVYEIEAKITSHNRNKKKQIVVDPERYKILEGLAEWWQEAEGRSCYYAFGVRKERGIVKDQDGNQIPDTYMVLVLQEVDQKGDIIEHAVAEDLVEGNGLYIIKSEMVGGHPWFEMLAEKKELIRALGARCLRHQAAEGKDRTDVMVRKVQRLLALDSNDLRQLHLFYHTRFRGTSADGTPNLVKNPREVDPDRFRELIGVKR